MYFFLFISADVNKIAAAKKKKNRWERIKISPATGPSLTSDWTAQCIDFWPTTTEANYETFGAYQGNDDSEKGGKKDEAQ